MDSFESVSEVIAKIEVRLSRTEEGLDVVQGKVLNIEKSIEKIDFSEEISKILNQEIPNIRAVGIDLERIMEHHTDKYPKFMENISKVEKYDFDKMVIDLDKFGSIDMDDIENKIRMIDEKTGVTMTIVQNHITDFVDANRDLIQNHAETIKQDGSVNTAKVKIEKEEISIDKPLPVVMKKPLTIEEFIAELLTNDSPLTKTKTYRSLLTKKRMKEILADTPKMVCFGDVDPLVQNADYYSELSKPLWKKMKSETIKASIKCCEHISSNYERYVNKFALDEQTKYQTSL